MSAVRVVRDRRPEYYARVADALAADPLDFYTRAERGRRWQSGFVARAFPSPHELLLRDAPVYDPGEPEPDQFDAPYADLSHGA